MLEEETTFEPTETDLEPTREEVVKFLQVIYRLSNFEASQRMIRGYGAFKTSELPIVEFTCVMAWLHEKYLILIEEVNSWKDDK